MTKKRIAGLTVAFALGISVNLFGTDTDGGSQDAVRQELAEVRQIVSDLVKQVRLLEGRIKSLEEVIAQRPAALLFPLDVERGMLFDGEEMKQRHIKFLDASPIELRN